MKFISPSGKFIVDTHVNIRKAFTKAQRAAAMAKTDGKCSKCDKPATDVDHIIPVQLGGEHILSNWQPMCKVHHKIKTAQDIKDIARARRRQKKHLTGRGTKRKGKPLQNAKKAWPKRKFGNG